MVALSQDYSHLYAMIEQTVFTPHPIQEGIKMVVDA